ncbi:glycosyltransferase [Paenibacillus sp. FSL K6-1566]|uniref:glycosyltransferase family 2 protein n=1 Tax=unclassified Paenibacillus TaxID=185978 RepID=UPI0031019C2F
MFLVTSIYYALLKFCIRFTIKYNLFWVFKELSVNWYNKWIAENEKLPSEQSEIVMDYKPIISIILPVYNAKRGHLIECIESVIKQTYPYWELCIADDCSTLPHVREVLEEYKSRDERIRVVYREQNGHISACSNSAFELANGEFIALLDNDDILSPIALFEVVSEINKFPNVDIIYSDEDKLLGNTRTQPFFKKNWNPKLLFSLNYFCHLVVYRTTIIEKLGGFRVGYEGVQDWDLAIRAVQVSSVIRHIPKVLYHWRISPTSTAGGERRKPYIKKQRKKMLSEYK